MSTPLLPSPLKKGDTLGIVAPAGQLQDQTRFWQGVEILQEMGFRVKFPQALWPGPGYLADSDENRSAEFNRLLADEEIKGLIALRGGYGCLRILDKIDVGLVVRNPKLLVGFSDISILQNYLYARTGLISLHGPVVTSLGNLTEEGRISLFHCLTGTSGNSIGAGQLEVLREGPEAEAPLVGGNLASLVTLLGTRYDFSWDKKIVFLEDLNEPIYKIDRMLMQLKLVGKLDNIAGLLLGDFSMPAGRGQMDPTRYRESVWNLILNICSGQAIPIWGNFPSGHCPGNLTFPLGAEAVMDKKNIQVLFR